ncbi:restriction endonuclease-like protein [Haloterrigena turkmenica DSM 5511]|uniref:Restriction endonuclease-like protein n=1 Tax=Haloterrigena turkmenica (strain ATCC 51198 / DSM 5511 / JCM 9101 / NCIMB 13204 / VKM B-1734 / 4k) TaxID=543526 RepID=D2RPV1_HALTV|nr:HNH endonuclease [Haloterrigena turkmenica]ADB62253.1 restriction endonuclease-like protein [Haloterrigena turkmenica DSM 5511]
MGERKRNIAVRFFGGAGNYTAVLEEFCHYVLTEDPDLEGALEWVKANTRATSDAGIADRLRFLESIGLLALEEAQVELTDRGIRWVAESDPEILFDALVENVHGFETLLEALLEGPQTDAELGDAIAADHPAFDWTDPSGPAQHRGWLQSLGYVERSAGLNSLTDSGERLARRIASRLPTLEPGTDYAQSELEAAFDTGFGSYIKGINPRTDDDGELAYIILKAREDGPYGDDLTGERFTYIGEGVPSKGDQQLTPANGALVNHAEGAVVPIYFFYQPADADRLRYEGLVDIVDAEYVADPGGERLVYRFTMERLEIEDPTEFEALADSVVDGDTETGSASAESETSDDSDGSEPPLTADEEEFTATQRRVRSSTFAKRVKTAYGRRCAICGASRESPAGTVDIEAAHIYPKKENGRDTVRNGLALCRLHHWAFDAGWLAVTDDYRVLVADRPDLEGYEEFARLEGEELTLPAAEVKRPHATFLAAHRERHGFESS